MTNIAFVGFFASMNAEMSFQLEGIGAGICAMRALVGPLARVAPHVSLELAQLDGSIVAFRAPVWLFVGVAVTDVANQFA